MIDPEASGLVALTVQPGSRRMEPDIDARRRKLIRLAFIAFGDGWREWLAPTLAVDPDYVARMLAGDEIPENVLALVGELARKAETARVHEILSAVAHGLLEDGVPRAVVAAHLAYASRSLMQDDLD